MEINVLIDEALEAGPATDWVQSVVEKVLTVLNLPPEAEVSLVITTQQEITRLNRQYLKKDRPTDVISFYMTSPHDSPDADSFILPPDSLLHLGEVIISYPQAVIQAEEHKHTVARELTILIIHGILHLIGYEDEKPDLKKKMSAKELEILTIIEQELPEITG